MTLPGLPYLLAAAFVSGGTAAWYVQGLRADSAELAAEKAQVALRNERAARIDSAASAVGSYTEKERIKYVYVNRTIKEVVKAPFYSDTAPLCLDDAGLRALAQTRQPASAASQPERTVPEVRSP